MSWMAWTTPTAALFVFIFSALAGMTLWELRRPCTPRRGLLPFVTTRGDRFFLGLLAAGFACLACIGLTDASGWFAGVAALAALAGVGRWG